MSKDFFGHSVYFLTETPGERRLNPVTTAAGIFQPPPALRTTSPIFCVAKHRGGVYESSTIPQGIGEGIKGHSPFGVER